MFTVTKEVLESCEALVTLEIEESAVKDTMQKAARNVARENAFPGFRKGKVPYTMVLNRVGEDVLRREAAELLVEKIYADVLEQAEVEAIGPGSMEDIQLEPMVLKIRIPLAPVVVLGDYSDLRLSPEPDSVTDAELDAALEHLRHEHTVAQPVSRPAAIGDQINIEHIEAQVDGKVFIHQHDVGLVLDPDGETTLPGLVEALVGLSAGEEKMFHLTLPSDFSEPELRDADAEFTVQLESVAEPILPALDDAFASVVGNFESLEELRADLLQRMLTYKSERSHEVYHEALVAKLVADAEVRYPEVLLKEELDDTFVMLKSRIPQQTGMAWEDFLRLQGQTEEQIQEGLRPRAGERLTERLVLEEFARQSGIVITEEELRGYYKQLLQQMEIPQHKQRPFNMNLVIVQDLRKQVLRERAIAELERVAQGTPSVEGEIMAVETDVVETAEA